MGQVAVSPATRRASIVVLTLIAEVLSGETRITPGGAVDTETACCPEAFTWDGWLEQLRASQLSETEIEVTAGAATPIQPTA
jgi:hypothetical protein